VARWCRTNFRLWNRHGSHILTSLTATQRFRRLVRGGAAGYAISKITTWFKPKPLACLHDGNRRLEPSSIRPPLTGFAQSLIALPSLCRTLPSLSSRRYGLLLARDSRSPSDLMFLLWVITTSPAGNGNGKGGQTPTASTAIGRHCRILRQAKLHRRQPSGPTPHVVHRPMVYFPLWFVLTFGAKTPVNLIARPSSSEPSRRNRGLPRHRVVVIRAGRYPRLGPYKGAGDGPYASPVFRKQPRQMHRATTPVAPPTPPPEKTDS